MEMIISGGKPGSKKEEGGRDEWEVKEAVSTLLKAKEIEADEGLMKLVHEEIAKKEKAIRSISDLKKVASKAQNSLPKNGKSTPEMTNESEEYAEGE